MPEVFALVDAHVALWTELYEAAAGGDQDALRVLIRSWCPTIAGIEALMPLLADRPLDGWNSAISGTQVRCCSRALPGGSGADRPVDLRAGGWAGRGF
jgi:hypothetical protein